jgi:hypothetical protein
MKLFQVVEEITVNTDFGPHTFMEGQIIELIPDEAYPLVKSGHLTPSYTWSERREMQGIDPELQQILSEIKTLFEDSHIEEIRQPFHVSECRLVPAPFGKCHRFSMKLHADSSLAPYCKKGQSFCPNAKKKEGGEP